MKHSFPGRNRFAVHHHPPFACSCCSPASSMVPAGHAQTFTSLAIAPAQPTVNIGGNHAAYRYGH